MNILILTIGTRGDVQPFLALSLALQARGHSVTLAAPPDARAFVESRGVAYRALGTDMAELLSRSGIAGNVGPVHLLRFLSLRRRYAAELFRKAGRDVLDLLPGADLVVYKTPLLIAGLLADSMGIPGIEAGFVPLLPTRRNTGILFSGRNLGAPANWILSSLVSAGVRSGTKRRLKELRRGNPGLVPHARRRKDAPLLYAFSPVVYERPSDWGGNVHLTGYWFLPPDPKWKPPGDLSAFLDSGDKPVYFGFGSMPNRSPERVMAMIREVLARLGARGIVNRGWAGLAEGEDGLPDLFFVDDVPHEWLFPRVSVAVHHGGAGTTAAALRAGIPSVIVPHLGDQPMWGRILHELGASARSIPADKLNVNRLERALREALEDGRMGGSSRDLARFLSAEDGVGNAVRVIEECALGAIP